MGVRRVVGGVVQRSRAAAAPPPLYDVIAGTWATPYQIPMFAISWMRHHSPAEAIGSRRRTVSSAIERVFGHEMPPVYRRIDLEGGVALELGEPPREP